LLKADSAGRWRSGDKLQRTSVKVTYKFGALRSFSLKPR
jgi:hypothetical protein